MFLMPAGGPDFQRASEPVLRVLARCEAEVMSIKPWDERRLAFEIGGQRRGLYILTYFKADPSRIGEIEHDCQLDPGILRAMILRRDRLSQEQVQAATPALVRASKSSDLASEEADTKPAEAAADKSEAPEPVPAPDTPERAAGKAEDLPPAQAGTPPEAEETAQAAPEGEETAQAAPDEQVQAEVDSEPPTT